GAGAAAAAAARVRGPRGRRTRLLRDALGLAAPALLAVSAVATAITAGFGEELVYRSFLQTRLEALLGPWSGLLLASLLFGLMHTPSHGEGPLWADAAQVIALQGTSGIALGMMWRRWRRLWVCVLAHVLLNGLGVLLHLIGMLA